MILLLDNYDSFVHNLARYLRRLGQQTQVIRSDAIHPQGIRELQPAALVISPGPGTPQDAGCSLQVVRELWREIPLLGVCLGHQVIAAAFGANIVRAPQPRHGRTSEVHHAGQGIFAGVPNPVTVCRYHSLVVVEETLPPELLVTGRTTDGVLMAFQHSSRPIVGVQFHPEAILTQHGYAMLANFLQLAAIPLPSHLPSIAEELREPQPLDWNYPDQPLTF